MNQIQGMLAEQTHVGKGQLVCGGSKEMCMHV